MSDSLTTLISKVQNILGDSSATYFTTAICTAAIRQALSEWNLRAPIFGAEVITGVNDQYEYELTDVNTDACEIFDVLRQGDNNDEIDTPLQFDAYIEDERLFFRLRHPVTSSDTLICRFTQYHTINGLDSETESTLLARDDQAMVDGGAFYAIMIRATARVETINLSQDQSDNYREIAGGFAAAFAQRLNYAARTRKPPVGEPARFAWNDQYHGWDQ